MIYVKQNFYSLCNREFILHCARWWSYCHFRGEINIRCLADIFFPWRSLIQLQDPVCYIQHDLVTAKVPQGMCITPENWLFMFINGDSFQSGRKEYFFEKLVAIKNYKRTLEGEQEWYFKLPSVTILSSHIQTLKRANNHCYRPNTVQIRQ